MLLCRGLSLCILAPYGRAQSMAAGEWLSKSQIVSSRGIEGVLSLTRFLDEMYVVNTEFRWVPNTDFELKHVIVPRGFVTDLASVPTVFYTLFRPDGQYAQAAVVHDYLYWCQVTSRKLADQVFEQAMQDLLVSPFQKKALFEAVSALGERSWQRNAAMKRQGERRILKIFPSSPTMTWREWKMKADVFLE